MQDSPLGNLWFPFLALGTYLGKRDLASYQAFSLCPVWRWREAWSVLSPRALKLVCSAEELYQHSILLLHFSFLSFPSHPPFPVFCRLWLCRRSWNPFGARHFMRSCWETTAAARWSFWSASSFWSLIHTTGIVSNISQCSSSLFLTSVPAIRSVGYMRLT